MEQWEINAIKEERSYLINYLRGMGFNFPLDNKDQVPPQEIDRTIIESSCYSFYEKKRQAQEGLSEKHFYEDQIEYLSDLSKDLKEEYNFIVKPLLDYFKIHNKKEL